jgi:hypothetical protein
VQSVQQSARQGARAGRTPSALGMGQWWAGQGGTSRRADQRGGTIVVSSPVAPARARGSFACSTLVHDSGTCARGDDEERSRGGKHAMGKGGSLVMEKAPY